VTRRRVVVLASLVALNLAVFLVYTFPRAIQERSLASQADTLEAEVQHDQRAVAALKERADIIRSNGKDVERFYKDIVTRPKEGLLPTLQYVEKTAEELGLTAKSRAYTERDVKGLPLVEFVIAMPLSGPYKQIVAFLDRLERSSRFLIVDEVQLHSRTDVGADLGFSLSAYFRAEPGEGHGP
jgi:Tfp pilus assembly protein PilO